MASFKGIVAYGRGLGDVAPSVVGLLLAGALLLALATWRFRFE